MIPEVVPRKLLTAANGIFILTLNAAFALGFALLGPLVVNITGSAETVILIVALLFFVATIACVALPSAPPSGEHAPGSHEGAFGAVVDAEHAVASTLAELREGIGFIQSHRTISWSLVYLGITASLVGVLGVLGPDFAEETLGLTAKDLAVVVLPMGFGIVMGILLLNAYGKYVPRRRVIEGGLISLGVGLLLLSIAGRISAFLSNAEAQSDLLDLSSVTSLLGVVVVLAFFAGIAYGFVAIPSQTQLQEDLPEDVRGRVFGVLNMLVSIASFLPIIIVGPLSDLVGTTVVILAVATSILIAGIASVVVRGPLRPEEAVPGRSARGRPDRRGPRGRPTDAGSRLNPLQRARPAPNRGHRRAAKRRRQSAWTPPIGTDARATRPGRLHRRDDLACSTTRLPAATCRRSMERRSSPGPRARRVRRGRGDRPRAHPGQSLHVPDTDRDRGNAPGAAGGPGRRRRGRRPGHRHDRGDCLRLGPPPRRPEARRRDRGDAHAGPSRLRRAGQPARRRCGGGIPGAARRRASSCHWPVRSRRPTMS